MDEWWGSLLRPGVARGHRPLSGHLALSLPFPLCPTLFGPVRPICAAKKSVGQIDSPSLSKHAAFASLNVRAEQAPPLRIHHSPRPYFIVIAWRTAGATLVSTRTLLARR